MQACCSCVGAFEKEEKKDFLIVFGSLGYSGTKCLVQWSTFASLIEEPASTG